jgi:hypothetical protein
MKSSYITGYELRDNLFHLYNYFPAYSPSYYSNHKTLKASQSPLHGPHVACIAPAPTPSL